METRRRIVEGNGNGKGHAEYADLPPGVGFAAKNESLRRDINLLGKVLGEVIPEQEGKGLFGAEEIRDPCKRRTRTSSGSSRRRPPYASSRC